MFALRAGPPLIITFYAERKKGQSAPAHAAGVLFKMKTSHQILIALLVLGVIYLFKYASEEGRRECISKCKLAGTEEFIYIPEQKSSTRVSRGMSAIINSGNDEKCICLTEEYLIQKEIEYQEMRGAFACLERIKQKYPDGDYPLEAFSDCN